MMTDELTVYWRPGCGFCARLFTGLGEAAIEHKRVNIWEDPAAAAFVRSVAGGNETVPTVTLGSKSFVNPDLGDLQQALA